MVYAKDTGFGSSFENSHIKALNRELKLKTVEISKLKRKNKLMIKIIDNLCDECSSCLTDEDAVSYHEWATDIKEQIEEIDNE